MRTLYRVLYYATIILPLITWYQRRQFEQFESDVSDPMRIFVRRAYNSANTRTYIDWGSTEHAVNHSRRRYRSGGS